MATQSLLELPSWWGETETRLLCDRIGVDLAAVVSLDPVERMQHLLFAFMLKVPFENLDLHVENRTRIPLDEQAAFRKIVEKKRGGYCFEINPTFGYLLRAVGVPSHMAVAWVQIAPPPPVSTHVSVICEHQGSLWLVDPGFAGVFSRPINLEQANEEQVSSIGEKFRVRHEPPTDKGRRVMITTSKDGVEYTDRLAIDLQPVPLSIFGPGNDHVQGDKGVIAAKSLASHLDHANKKRVTFTCGRVITTCFETGERTTRSLESVEEAEAFLREQYGIVLESRLALNIDPDSPWAKFLS